MAKVIAYDGKVCVACGGEVDQDPRRFAYCRACGFDVAVHFWRSRASWSEDSDLVFSNDWEWDEIGGRPRLIVTEERH